ncbi:unnamed protein product [Penicillium discolor]
MCSRGKRCVSSSDGRMCPAWMCSSSRGHCLFTGAWLPRTAHRGHQRTVRAEDRHGAALAHAVDGPVHRDGGAALQLELGRGHVLDDTAVRLRADRVDHDVRAEVAGRLLQREHDVTGFVEVHRLGEGEVPCLLEPVVEVVDDDDPSGAEEPGRAGGGQADGPGAEHDHRVPFGDVGLLRAEVAGGERVREQQRVFGGEPLRDHRRADIGERHAHALRLPAVVPACRVRVAVDPPDRGRIGVHVVAVREEAAAAEVARAAVDVERHHHPVARTKRLHGGADLLDHPDDLMTEGVPDAGVGHHAVEEMEIRPAHGCSRDPHDRVVGVLDRRIGFLLDADLVRSAVGHRLHRVLLLCVG